jgi:hypothetical protein
MNIINQILSAIIVIGSILIAIKIYNSPDQMIPVGKIYTEKKRVYTPARVETVEVVKSPVYIPKRDSKPVYTKTKVIAPPVPIVNPIFNDAVLALTKLGYKKKEAALISGKLINEGVKDLNELILRAFKK